MFLQTGRKVTAHESATMGMLSTEAGLGAMEKTLRLFMKLNPSIPVVGVAPQTYWNNLLHHVKPVPPMYQELGIKIDEKKASRQREDFFPKYDYE